MNKKEFFFAHVVESLERDMPPQSFAWEVELISLLTIYASLSYSHWHFFQEALPSQFILDELQSMSDSHRELNRYLKGTANLVAFHRERLDRIINELVGTIERSSPVETFHKCVISTKIAKLEQAELYVTPSEVSEITKLVGPCEPRGHILDLNARLGEWSQQTISEHVTSVELICSHPFHFFVTTLKARLLNIPTYHFKLQPPYKLEVSKASKTYDFVFANPPFGKAYACTHGMYQSSLEAQFLQKAILATGHKGKVAFVIPQGFLFKSSRNSHEYQLRKELTDARAVKAIVGLPEQAFQPHAKLKTAVLLIDFTSKSNGLCFINLTKEGYSRCSSLITTLECLIHNDKEVPSSADYTAIRVSTESIREHGYDWQQLTYLPNPSSWSRDLSEIEQELDETEKELEITQKRISNLLAQMRQST